MNTEQFAVLVYGSLAIVAALVLATIAHSPLGAAIAFAAAGATYLFQMLQLPRPDATKLLAGLMLAAIALAILSTFVSLIAGSFTHVL